MRRFFYQRRSVGKAGLKTQGLWFFYAGQPVYLIGSPAQPLYGEHFVQAPAGSSEKDIRDAWTSQLDHLRVAGINLVRLFPWTFCWDAQAPSWACAFPQIASPAGAPVRYELSRSHEPFTNLLRFVCREAHRRDLLVALALWDDQALAPGGALGGPWMRHPFHTLCGGPCGRPTHFYDLEQEENRELQEKLVRRMLAATSEFSNVLYNVCNEVGASAPDEEGKVGHWLRHHLELARRLAPGRLLGVSGSAWSADGGSAEGFWQENDVDVLLPHETDGRVALGREQTAHQFRFYSREKLQKPRLVGETVFHGAAAGDDARKHFWVALSNGGHAACPNEQPRDALLDYTCRALRDFLCHSGVRWWEMQPVEGVLSPDPGQAYALGNVDRGEYLVYFLERPETDVVLTLPAEGPRSVLAWIDPLRGVVSDSTLCDAAPLVLPAGRGDVALWVRPEQG